MLGKTSQGHCSSKVLEYDHETSPGEQDTKETERKSCLDRKEACTTFGGRTQKGKHARHGYEFRTQSEMVKNEAERW